MEDKETHHEAAPLHQPHDKLFKSTFSNLPEAVGLLSNHLPALLAKQLDFSKLESIPQSFIDEEFKHTESDLLFSIPIKDQENKIQIYILLEHQSTEDSQISLRLLRYMTRIWKRFQDQHANQPLPVVFPLVLAQGSKKWKTTTKFKNLFNLPKPQEGLLLSYLPQFEFHLIQLAEIPYPKIKGTPDGILILTALKAQPVKELMSDWLWGRLINEVSPNTAIMLIRYIIDQEDVDKKTLLNRINGIQKPLIREHTMTVAEQLRQEGYESAKLEVSRTTLQRLLFRKYGALPEWVIEKISIADLTEIESFLERVVDDIYLEELLS